MEHLFGGNNYFQFINKHKTPRISVEQVKQFRNLSSPALSPLMFQEQNQIPNSYSPKYQHKITIDQPRKSSISMYKVQLGEIGQKYDEHLRKTVRSQTKSSFKYKKDMKNWVDESINKAITTLERQRQEKGGKSFSSALSNNAYETLGILRRNVLKDDVRADTQKVMQLNVKKLPMLEKKMKKPRISMYDPQMRQIELNDSRFQRGYGGYGSRKRKGKAEKPQICGWDMEATEYFG